MSYDGPIRVGEARPSQLLWSQGVGAIVDLPNISVIVAGLEDWNLEHAPPIPEARLLAGVRRMLGPQVARLVAPPIPPDGNRLDPFSEEARIGVPVSVFPRYLRCPFCQLLAPIESGLFQLKRNPYRPETSRYVHEHCQKRKAPTAVPARFLVSCRNGHLDDFPWRYFVHRGPSDCKGSLRFFEQGASLETSDLWVRCTGTCNSKSRSMAEAFGEKGKEALPRCRGRHPHLRSHDPSCDQPLRAILLGASNSWFPVLMTLLSVPTEAGELEQVVGDNWHLLEGITSSDHVDVVVSALQKAGQLFKLKKYSTEEIWETIESFRALGEADEEEDSGEQVDFKGPEWDVFVADDPPSSPDFLLRPVDVPERFVGQIESVRLAERIREVNALVGFVRVEPPDQVTVGESAVKRAPLSKTPPTWVPAVEVRGEGIFLRFDPEKLAQWESSEPVQARAELLRRGHVAWRAARKLDPGAFPGVRHVMLHSLAHLLIREFSLECGYGTASIRERIYASEPGDERNMAGIFLYTAAPDSEGTLGGLVALGEPESLEPLLDGALRRAAACASDPLCSEHEPGIDRSLHGAACHACLFVPETSCENGNRYLDRALVVPTFVGAGPALFELAVA